jgi:hypothetical protein
VQRATSEYQQIEERRSADEGEKRRFLLAQFDVKTAYENAPQAQADEAGKDRAEKNIEDLHLPGVSVLPFPAQYILHPAASHISGMQRVCVGRSDVRADLCGTGAEGVTILGEAQQLIAWSLIRGNGAV